MDEDDLITELDPELQWRARALLSWLRAGGVPARIISGARSAADNLRVGGAPSSYHLRGLAFDLEVAGVPRDQVPSWFWQLLGYVAETYLDLYWGGRFLHAGAPDVNHFDLRRIKP